MAISRRKFIVFALLTTVLVIGAGAVLTLTADLILHHRAERSAGLNRWGYRGPVLAPKKPGELRVAMLGGSTAFGYGVMWNESIPALLAQRLNEQHPDRAWTGVNLGYNTEGAYAFLPNLRDFVYLDYDIVVLYEGYNDMLGDTNPNYVTVRQQSPVFRATGYFPILPLWLDEKSLALRAGGTVAQGYDKIHGDTPQTVFRPNLGQRASASAVDAAAAVAGALERQFARVGEGVPSGKLVESSLGCPDPWSSYCESEHRAIQFALDHGKRVLVVGQPQLPSANLRERHQQQQQALADMLRREYASNARVAYFAVGARLDLSSTNLSFDQMHLNPDGNRIVADALAEPVFRLSRQ
jgi:lysophospholipase L1-like esterase